ncbi:hypothetical protein C0J52_26512 [Blattella germanica]|nr:hypothetical protein C0J52_26512 [Blattella germanica]
MPNSDPLLQDRNQTTKAAGISLVPTALLLKESALKIESTFGNSGTKPQPAYLSSLNDTNSPISEEAIPVSKLISNIQVSDLPGISRSSNDDDDDDDDDVDDDDDIDDDGDSEMLTIEVEPDIFQDCSPKSPESPVSPKKLLTDPKLRSLNSDSMTVKIAPKGGVVKTFKPLATVQSKEILDKLLKTRSLTKSGQKKPILLKFGVDPSKASVVNLKKSSILKFQSIPKISTASPSNLSSTSALRTKEEDRKQYQTPQTRSKKFRDELNASYKSSQKDIPDKPFVVKSIFRLFDDKMTEQHCTEQNQGISSSNSITETSSPGQSLLKLQKVTSDKDLESQKCINTPPVTVLKSGVSRTWKIGGTVSSVNRPTITQSETDTRPKRLLMSRTCKKIADNDPLWAASSSASSSNPLSASLGQDKTVPLKGVSVAENAELAKAPVHFLRKNVKLLKVKSPFTCCVCNTVLQDINEYTNHLKYKCKEVTPPQVSKND